MRMFRFLLALTLVCGLTSFARADQDFRMVILDPDFPTTPIFSTPFQFSFSPCVEGQLPTDVQGTYVGCFTGVNRTGNDWIGVQMTLVNTDILAGQDASCIDGGADIYQSAVCSLDPDGSSYTLTYTIGNIPNNGTFTIAEDGVDPLLFPPVTMTAITSPIPEPSSLLLFSTGLLGVVTVTFGRRPKYAARVSRG